MRPIVFVIIASVVTLMGYLALQPTCAGGAVVATEEACIAKFDAGFCRTAFVKAQKIATTSGPAYGNQSECQDRHNTCVARTDINAYSPKPSGFCLVRDTDGSLARIDPQFDRRP